MYCENCGAKIEDGSIFCEECGAKVENVNSEQTRIQNKNQTNVGKQSISREKICQTLKKFWQNNKKSIIFSEFRLNATLLTFGINSLFAAFARIFFSSPNVAI